MEESPNVLSQLEGGIVSAPTVETTQSEIGGEEETSLCRLVLMPMVRPMLSSDLQKIKQEFAHGYLDGMATFYVSTTNEAGESSQFSNEEVDSWNDWWKHMNADFNAYMESLPELNFTRNMKFFMCDKNHRRIAWMNHITKLYSSDPDWHTMVDCIILPDNTANKGKN